MSRVAEKFMGSSIRSSADYGVVKNPYDGREATKVAICSEKYVFESV